MVNSLSVALAGALFGCVHVLGGPDHVVSLLPFSVEARGQAWRIGLRWGVGHALGIVGVGVVARVARGLLDLEKLQSLGEPMVGLVLVGIGLWGLYHAQRLDLAATLRDADAAVAKGAPGEAHGAHVHGLAALAVGGVHGIAGSAAVLGVIPVVGLDSPLAAASHLFGFAIGTVASMVGLAVLLGYLTDVRIRMNGAEIGQTYRHILMGASLIALVVGVAFFVLALLR